jgi:hypothetical protein
MSAARQTLIAANRATPQAASTANGTGLALKPHSSTRLRQNGAGGVQMTKWKDGVSEQYRERARRLQDCAGTTELPNQRATYLAAAERWLGLARHADSLAAEVGLRESVLQAEGVREEAAIAPAGDLLHPRSS